MNAAGYKSDPISDAMEKRIRERIKAAEHVLRLKPLDFVSRVWVAALEWVLSEAESFKDEKET